MVCAFYQGAVSAPPTQGHPKPFRCWLFRHPSVRKMARADLAVPVCNRSEIAHRITSSARKGALVSVDLIVYLPRASMPTPARWAEAIRNAGFPVELETDFDPDTAIGFLPCRYEG